jgi:hypothetical protein
MVRVYNTIIARYTVEMRRVQSRLWHMNIKQGIADGGKHKNTMWRSCLRARFGLSHFLSQHAGILIQADLHKDPV